jgi:hypothetical protein
VFVLCVVLVLTVERDLQVKLPMVGAIQFISVQDAKSLQELRVVVRKAARSLLSHPDLSKVCQHLSLMTKH